MNKQKIIGIVVGVLVVAGLVWWFVGRAPSSAPGNMVEGTATQAGSATPMSLKALFAAGISQKCTIDNSNNGGNSSGTIYMTSGHMRADFSSQDSDGKTVSGHLITDGTTSWIWTDAAPEGMKMSFTATSSMQAQNSAHQGGSIDPNAAMNYSCSPWSPDQSEFTLPSNITFSDMSQMMNPAAGASAGAGAKVGGSAAECSACNEIPSASGKSSCLAAMGCK